MLAQRDRPAIVVGSVAAAGLVVFQAWLGKVTVESELSGEIVTAHLATAMGLFAILLFVWVRSRYPRQLDRTGGWSGFTILAALAALATYGLMLLGAHVTATGTALVFEDWPFMDGGLFPVLDPGVLPHVLHRWATVAVGILVAGLVVAARRGREPAPLPAIATAAGVLYLIQVVVGGAQVLTDLAPWTQVAHVALGAGVFGVLSVLAMSAHYLGRAGGVDRGRDGTVAERPGRRPARVRGPDQAPDHRAPAGHHRPDHGVGRGRDPIAAAGGSRARRRFAGRRRRERHQPVPRP